MAADPAADLPPTLAVTTTVPDPAPAGGTPVTVPGYTLLGELGRGGMGVVYQAVTADGRLVALKVLRGGAQADAEERERFRREAQAGARLDHPNIVRVLAVGEAQGLPYLAMEFLPGGSLAAHCRDPWPERAAAELVRLLAGAVQHAHDRGVVHRDLKPANVLVGGWVVRWLGGSLKEGSLPLSQPPNELTTQPPKVADFGLAKVRDAGPSLTATTSLMGTPAYMAPEQAAGKAKQSGPAVDVYALGAILYHLLTGRPPFLGETVLEILDQVRFQDAAPAGTLRPGLSPYLEAVCQRCLAKAPDHRYPSAADLAADLERFLAGLPPLDRVAPQLQELPDPAAPPLPRIPGFEVLGPLERCGGGHWRARQLAPDRPVALLLVEPAALPAEADRARFRERVAAWAGLSHPHLTAVLAHGAADGGQWVALEPPTRGSLGFQFRSLGGEPPPAPRHVAAWAAAVARGLDHAHRHGLIHGRLEPDCVWLDALLAPRVTGFALPALPFTGGVDRPPVQPSAAYLAPEQLARPDDSPPVSADVHALGLVLYEVLTGRRPYQRETPEATRAEILHHPPTPLERLRAGIPTELEAITLRCLAKAPADRYPSAAAVADALDGFLADRPAAGAPWWLTWANRTGYDLLGEEVAGRLTTVYRVRHRPTGQERRLQASNAAADPEGAAARWAGRLRRLVGYYHPHLIRLHEVHEDAGRAALVWEHVAGGSLARYVAGAARAWQSAVALVEPLAGAVAELHAVGLLHLNLQAANVLLGDEAPGPVEGLGLPKVAGLDFARLTGEAVGDVPLPDPPTALAPEVRDRRDADVGPAADVYGLGVLLHELLTGGPPGSAGPPLRPPEVAAVVRRCLERDPARRWPDAAALAAELRRLLQPPDPEPPPEPWWRKVAGWLRRG